ncbi:MAG: hypothetical protein ABEJ25_04205 [Candidatus Bipolaricaulia bacterium]
MAESDEIHSGFQESFDKVPRSPLHLRREKTMQAKNIIRVAIGVGLILMVPLIAMQFTEEVVWGVADFVIMGTLLFGTGLGLEVTLNKLTKPVYRATSCTVIVVAFLLIWAELAVGVFGTPWAGS